MITTKKEVRKAGGRFRDGVIHFANEEVYWLDGSLCNGTIIYQFEELEKGKIEVSDFGDFIVRGKQKSVNNDGKIVEFEDGEEIGGGDMLEFFRQLER